MEVCLMFDKEDVVKKNWKIIVEKFISYNISLINWYSFEGKVNLSWVELLDIKMVTVIQILFCWVSYTL